MDLERIRVLIQPPVAPFELGVFHEVFGIDRTDEGVPAFDYQVCAENRELQTPGGLDIRASKGLEACEDADLLALPCGPLGTPPSEEVLATIRAVVNRGARVLSVCTGAFTLAATGLLEDRPCCVHWRYAEQFRRQFPNVLLDTDALYRQTGPITTSAGTAAGIDACLHVVRDALGQSVANMIARRMVVAPHRDGGQRQFIEHPLPAEPGSNLAELIDWLEEQLDKEHTLESISQRAHVSPRTLLRRFKAETGETPVGWLTGRRVARAQHLLEASDLPMDEVARQSGLRGSALLRHHFRRRVGISPLEYRKRFRSPASGPL